MNPSLSILQGDALTVLKTLPDESVQCCVSSPPYWGLRSYLPADHPLKRLEMGSERTPEEFIQKMVAVFREVRRVLKADGTCWVNIGDSYNTRPCTEGVSFRRDRAITAPGKDSPRGKTEGGLKPKDLVGIPWMLAFALRADGWYLRQDIIWAKPNTMPESVTDRCTKAHEYIFLLSKSPRYFYDADAILEKCSPNTHSRISQNLAAQVWSDRANGGRKTNGNMKAVFRKGKTGVESHGVKNNPSFAAGTCLVLAERNKRSVWSVPVGCYSDAHFATFPPDLIRPCILAGSRQGDTVLDPFGGSGTTGQVALEYGRSAILIELNPAYIPLIEQRTNVTPSML